jgi:hypothetical protein
MTDMELAKKLYSRMKEIESGHDPEDICIPNIYCRDCKKFLGIGGGDCNDWSIDEMHNIIRKQPLVNKLFVLEKWKNK